MLYRWRSLEATVKIREAGGLSPNLENTRELLTPGNINQQELIKCLHTYSTIDKTSRLKMKTFSTLRDTQRGSQSYMEKRRGRREIEVTRRRRWGVKMGE